MPLFLVEDSVRKIYVLAKDWQAAFTAWSDKVEDDFDCAPIDEDTPDTEPLNKVSMQLLAGDGEVLIQREIQSEIRNDLPSKSDQPTHTVTGRETDEEETADDMVKRMLNKTIGVNDPPINSAIKCPNCDSMSYYTDGHHQLTCSVCLYVAPSPG